MFRHGLRSNPRVMVALNGESEPLGCTVLQKGPGPSGSIPIQSGLDRHCEAAIAHEHQKYSVKEFPVGGSRRLHRPLGSLSLSA